jgi:hypothetical protein
VLLFPWGAEAGGYLWLLDGLPFGWSSISCAESEVEEKSRKGRCYGPKGNRVAPGLNKTIAVELRQRMKREMSADNDSVALKRPS